MFRSTTNLTTSALAAACNKEKYCWLVQKSPLHLPLIGTAVTGHLNVHALPMLQACNCYVSYHLRAWSLLDTSVALWDLETTFSANQFSVSNLL